MRDLAQPLFFLPNIRSEKAGATSGYLWGKPFESSHIVEHLPSKDVPVGTTSFVPGEIISERWMCSDDPANGSTVVLDGVPLSFRTLLDEEATHILGPLHILHFGAYLGCVMKQLDTNAKLDLGGLSVQTHPATGHPSRPTKPEMWKGTGSVYLGWKEDMSPEKIRAAYESNIPGAIEKLMNVVELENDLLVLVHGGLIHAIRAGSFLSEWSKAPHAADIEKGNLSEATVALWDRTDGKSPRPGKEDLEGTIEVMADAGTFGKSSVEELYATPTMLSLDQENNMLRKIFETLEVHVDEFHIATSFPVSLQDGGLPLFVAEGNVEVWKDGNMLARLSRGAECFLPYAMQSFLFKNIGSAPAVVQTWYAPIEGRKRTY